MLAAVVLAGLTTSALCAAFGIFQAARPASTAALLLENGSFLLLENGSKLLLE